MNLCLARLIQPVFSIVDLLLQIGCRSTHGLVIGGLESAELCKEGSVCLGQVVQPVGHTVLHARDLLHQGLVAGVKLLDLLTRDTSLVLNVLQLFLDLVHVICTLFDHLLLLCLDLDLNVAGQDCHFLDLLGSLSVLLLKDGHSLVQALNVTIDVVEPVLSRPELVNNGLTQLIPEIRNSLGIGGDS